MKNLWWLVLFLFVGCMTKRQCVNTCASVVLMDRAEESSKRLKSDLKCTTATFDLEMCREEVKTLQRACR
ncbi:MAG: hypothetical protein V4587_06870 [Acidobacteriota bacterium]